MKNCFYRCLILLLILCCQLVFITTPVAAISTSPTTVTINWVYVYENCLEENDMLFWADYTVAYAATPTEPISSTYVLRLTTSAGVDIRDSLPYAYFQNGYAKGLCAIYFNAADVTSLGLTWGSANYVMRLDGNPAASWTGGGAIPIALTKSSSAFWWKTTTTIGQNQTIITSDILAEALSLEYAWNSTSYDMITSTTTSGSRLTTTGETYFMNVLPNLALLAPNALLTTQETLQLITTPVAAAYDIASDFTGSALDLTDSAAALHVGGMWLGVILTLGCIIFVVIHGSKEVNSYKPVILLTLPLIYIFTRIGWFPILLTIGIGLIAAFSLWYVFFYEKQSS